MLRCEAPVYRPKSLADALAMRADMPDATVIAGGTDVMVYLEGGTLSPSRLIDVWGVSELRWVAEDGHHFGAGATWTDLVNNASVPAVAREAALTVGAWQIQNRGTVGGNIANSSPAGDSLPVWLALDAEFELASVRGSRRVASKDYWLGYKRTALAADELIVAVHVPTVRGVTHFRKVGTRMAQSISKVVFCGRFVRGVEARIAFGSVGPTPMRLLDVESALVRQGPGWDIALLAQAAVKPIDDVRSTAAYRGRVVSQVLDAWFATF